MASEASPDCSPSTWRSTRKPVLASSTDGVGTKIAIARAAGRHDTIGIDLVAMVVDDLVVVGAEPLFMSDYIATGKVDPEKIAAIVGGIAEGCVRAGCALVGGETAEHPGVMAPDDYDVSGTGVGVVECRRRVGPAPVARRRRPDRAGVVRAALERVLPRPACPARARRVGPGFHAGRCSVAARWPTSCSSRPGSTPGTAWPWPRMPEPMASRTSPAVGWPATSCGCCRSTWTRSSIDRPGPRTPSSSSSPKPVRWACDQLELTFNLGVGMIAVVPSEQAERR